MSYWATRKTWPRGRSCQDKSGLGRYWGRGWFWRNTEDLQRLYDEIQQEEAYRRWHEQRMVQEMCSHEDVSPYPEGGWSKHERSEWLAPKPLPDSANKPKGCRMQAISPDAPAYIQQLRRVALYLRGNALKAPYPQGDLDAWRLVSELALAEQDRNLFLKWRRSL